MKDTTYKVHHILAHSYLAYFVLFLVGVALDVIFKLNFFKTPALVPLGFTFLVLASLLILWAQKTSREWKTENLRKEGLKKEHFCKGPYCYTRSPTHWGLFLLMLGFATVTNAFFVILSTLISFILARLTFLPKQEKVLEEKYGAPYLEYKKSVKL